MFECLQGTVVVKMFRRLLGPKKPKKKSSVEKPVEQTEDTVNVPIPVQAKDQSTKSTSSRRVPAKGRGRTSKTSKTSRNARRNRQSKGSTTAKTTRQKSEDGDETKNAGKGLRRRKKGRKPQFKRIPRVKQERKVGEVSRVKNDFYPADVDFKYTTPKENWVSCLGRGKEVEVDFGDTARIIRDATDE